IPWVSWVNVCKSKADGGLGIQDLRAVNLALLSKWRRRLLSGGQGIWRDILLSRYGSLYPSPHLGGRPVGFRGTSSWWKDVSLLGGPLDSISDRFSEGIGKKAGNGLLTSFWFEPWIGANPLKVHYQRLFQVS
ncbi:RNA-directed DNA polymerase (Reverse transcriptase), partial [Trifolium medium]|nr:RNA-directed DNA polymerase (Reverse transcriptase) [Trifolium medium]